MDTDAFVARKGAASIQALLQPGEVVVWTGVPKGPLFLSRRQGAAIAFGLVWWLALLWLGWTFRTFGDSPLLIVIGLVMLIGVLQDSWRTGRWLAGRIGEHYALTDRRVLVLDRGGRLRAEAGLLSAHAFRAAPPAGPRGAILLAEDAPLFSPTQTRALRLNPDEDAPRLSELVGHLAVFDLIRKTAAAWETRWAQSDDADAARDQGLS